jgi:hypothetical protein
VHHLLSLVLPGGLEPPLPDSESGVLPTKRQENIAAYAVAPPGGLEPPPVRLNRPLPYHWATGVYGLGCQCSLVIWSGVQDSNLL